MIGVLGEDDGHAKPGESETETKGLSKRALAFLGFGPFAAEDGVGRDRGREDTKSGAD